MQKKPTMNVRKCAEYLGCSVSHVYDLFKTGILDGYKVGVRKGTRIYVDSAKSFIFDRLNDK